MLHHGPASSGCFVLYQRKKIYRFFPPLLSPTEKLNDPLVDKSRIIPSADGEVGGVVPIR